MAKAKTDKKSKVLVISEKPSVAKDLTNALPGKFTAAKTHFEGEEYIVSFAVGHLVTICSPPEIDERLKSWSMDNLPILPQEFPLKPLPNTRSQLNALSKLIRRRDVKTIINACDAGREGELIFRYILQYVGDKALSGKALHRLWLRSMTKESILDGFKNLREDGDMLGLASAAKCRSEADWLIGINGSRALTGFRSRFGGFRLTPCGRVQTPTLSMIVTREEEINKFQPTPYWEIMGNFKFGSGDYSGKWFDSEFDKKTAPEHGRADRIWKKEDAENIIAKCKGKEAVVEETKKPTTQSCPSLYDLTSLQREANSRFGLSAKHTLDIMQGLYDRHKVLTYPRTDSKHLPENYIPTVEGVMKAFAGTAFEPFAKKVLSEKWIKPNKKIFDNTKISDHHAIIPTTLTPKGLSEVELKVYRMVTQRFIAIFFPVARYLITTRISVVEEEKFKTEGKILEDPGWKAVYGSGETDDALAELPKGKNPLTENLDLVEDQTRPPPRYTESTLLSMMESAGKLVDDEELREAMKERGLGTAATRAATIEGLIKDKYIVRNGKELTPTSKAAELLEMIFRMKIEELSSPEMTGEWEYRLEQISKKKISREEFMRDIAELTKNIVTKVKSFDEATDNNKKVAFKDPNSDQNFWETLSAFESEDGKIRIRKFLGGRRMSPEEVQLLLKERKLGPLTGFVSKAGKPFSAMIRLTDEDKVEFVFEELADNKPDFNTLEVAGISPIDGTKVYLGDVSYVSESYFDKDSKSGLKINRVLLGQEITLSNIKRMLNGEKTELIKGFRSSKTKRLFDAYLELNKAGKISFSFPPRKSFKKKPKAKAQVEG